MRGSMPRDFIMSRSKPCGAAPEAGAAGSVGSAGSAGATDADAACSAAGISPRCEPGRTAALVAPSSASRTPSGPAGIVCATASNTKILARPNASKANCSAVLHNPNLPIAPRGRRRISFLSSCSIGTASLRCAFRRNRRIEAVDCEPVKRCRVQAHRNWLARNLG